MSEEPFKVMEWLRKVRDENYERMKDLTPEERIRITQEEASMFRRGVEELRKSKAAQEPKGDN